MASEHMFGAGRGRVAARRAEQIDRVARRYGAHFTYATLPGSGPQYWFACATGPFQHTTEREVSAALKAAQLLPIGKL